jgi:arylsulfatase
MRSWLPVLAACLCTLTASAAPRPNLVVILADDLGFSDLGCYGGEIATPHLDALARDGLRFTQFTNTGRCCPTRAALLTGRYSHEVGVGHMTVDKGLPAYRGFLRPEVPTVAERLRAAGYTTLMTGKWHVGSQPSQWPLARGFDRYWGTPTGGGIYFKDSNILRPEVFFVDQDQQVEPPDDLHVTDTFTDRALAFVDEARRGERPFFLYLAHIAPHWALQAPEADIDAQAGRYDEGWDTLRARRYARQREIGLVPGVPQLPPRDAKAPAWDTLDAAARAERARRMEVYAAQVAALDRTVGRFCARLKEWNLWDNTVIVFLSDNGASAEGGPGGFSRGKPGAPIGSALSYASAGVEWANLSNTPFRNHKTTVFEGGVATPCLVHWPAGLRSPGAIRHEPAHVTDLLPTLLDLAGVPVPGDLSGISFAPLLRGETPPERGPIYYEHEGHRAIRLGEWKAVAPVGKEWMLYHLAEDRGETRDLAAEHPERLRTLRGQWQKWAQAAGVRDFAEVQRARRPNPRPADAKP